jgi:hypothetical protein
MSSCCPDFHEIREPGHQDAGSGMYSLRQLRGYLPEKHYPLCVAVGKIFFLPRYGCRYLRLPAFRPEMVLRDMYLEPGPFSGLSGLLYGHAGE